MTIPGRTYSILSKKENAHDDAIYCGVWTKITETGDSRHHGKDYLVTGGLDGLVKVWTLDDNQFNLLHSLKGHSLAVVNVAVSPDGHTIASASMDSTNIIWELTTGNKVNEIQDNLIWALAFSPDGAQLAVGAFNGRVNIYSVDKGVIVKSLDTRSQFGISMAWSPNGQYLAVGSVDGSLFIFDVPQSKLVHTVRAHSNSIRDVAFSPSSKLLATASSDGKLKVYDAESATLRGTLEHKCVVRCVQFGADGRVASGAADGAVRVASGAELTVLHAFHEHTEAVSSVQFSPSGNRVISVSLDKSINIYECPIPVQKK